MDEGMTMLLERGERECGVLRAQRRAVMKLRVGSEQKPVGAPVGADANRAGQKPVEGVRLVGSARHQGRKSQVHALRTVALKHVAIERVEGEERLIVLAIGSDLRECAALGGVRIDVVEMRKVG